jgi:triosephosphate isomerase
MHNKIIVANWKMNGDKALVQAYDNFLANYDGKYKVIICPPFTHISLFNPKNYYLGAQDCHEALQGAYTGCVSASMLHELSVKYVILGHNERRSGCFESDDIIRRKEKSALDNGIIPIVCIGETRQEKEAGQTYNILKKQLKNCLNGSPHTIIAYEPIWAIGTGHTPRYAEIEEIFRFLKTSLPYNAAIYGGSVNENNALEIINCEGVNGVLIGGTSLNLEAFKKIV